MVVAEEVGPGQDRGQFAVGVQFAQGFGGLGLTHAFLGAPYDAVTPGHQALDSVRARAGDLAALLARRSPRYAAVEGLREHLAATDARLLLPVTSEGEAS